MESLGEEWSIVLTKLSSRRQHWVKHSNWKLKHSSSEPYWVSEVAQSYPTLFDPVDCSLPGSSIHGILQARILEWVAISFSRGSPGIKPGSPALEADALTSETPGKSLRETKIAAPSLPFRMVSLHIITFNSQLPVKKFNTHISGGFGFFVLSCFSVSWSFPDFFFFGEMNSII